MSKKNPYDTERILAEGRFVSNNTRVTGINNNDLIIGPSGAGKTRGYVKPNIMQANESMVIVDTKGNLLEELGPLLRLDGYRILQIDFKSMQSTCRWNPLSYIKYDKENKCYSERDIAKVADTLCPCMDRDEPFWDNAARQYLEILIGFAMNMFIEEEQNLGTVKSLYNMVDADDDGIGMTDFKIFTDIVRKRFPKSPLPDDASFIFSNMVADRTHSCIMTTLGTHLRPISYPQMIKMYTHPRKFRFRELGQRKTALFVNISDTDRSMDDLVGLFYTQALQDLCDYADTECEDNRLPVPVRFILDDFAANFTIQDFDNITSIIRSREIYVSIILQSITQLRAKYWGAAANTIIDNCDHILYLGGQSLETADYISARANLPENDILNMPLDRAYLFERGKEPEVVHKYDITQHEKYSMLPEASMCKQ